MNFVPGVMRRAAEGDAILIAGNATPLPLPARVNADGAADGMPVILGVRPEHIARATGPTPPRGFVRLDTTIELLQPTGSRTYATFRLGDDPVVAELEAHDVSRPGEAISLDVNLARASLFDTQTERALLAG
jgi:multiple sugar transport system ATP-binding protein